MDRPVVGELLELAQSHGRDGSDGSVRTAASMSMVGQQCHNGHEELRTGSQRRLQ
ncbi:MAG: hypothetical protein AAF456_20495 [Planctomycetota bacterium]